MDEIFWENSTVVQTFEYSTEETNLTSTLERHDNVAYYSFVMIPVVLCFALGINLIYRCFHQDVRNVIQDV